MTLLLLMNLGFAGGSAAALFDPIEITTLSSADAVHTISDTNADLTIADGNPDNTIVFTG